VAHSTAIVLIVFPQVVFHCNELASSKGTSRDYGKVDYHMYVYSSRETF
jgi:hypothetical protein